MPELGFGPAPWPVRVYCNRTNGGNWYVLKDSEPEIIPHEALTGIPLSLTFPRVERRGQEVIKMNLVIQADKTYILEAGYDSQFSKSLMSCLSMFGPGSLAGQVITVVPSPGSDESVLFCRVFFDGDQVRTELPETPDWRAIALSAVGAIGGSQDAKD